MHQTTVDSPQAEALPAPQPAAAGAEAEGLFAASAELSLDALLQAVQERNPSLAEMAAAWQAALARYPQVTALEDPMLNQSFGPGTFGSTNVDFAFDVMFAQKIPFPGKRRLRGAAAQAEARAAGNDVEDTRLQLIESTRAAFYDYYLAERALAVNEKALRLLQEFRDNARARAATTAGNEQEPRWNAPSAGRGPRRSETHGNGKSRNSKSIGTLAIIPGVR